MDSYDAYDRPVEIAEGIFWVGFRDKNTNLFCNPYLVIEDEQAVLIDAGSRTDFAVVMMKILQAGIDPSRIVALIYQHYDPDLCGSMPNFIDMCDNPALKLISEKSNTVFLSYYIHRDRYPLLSSINERDFKFTFNNRCLRFISTPYAHSQGSFVTYDEKTRTLFTSDLFGSFSTEWDLFMKLEEACYTCNDYGNCPTGKTHCPFSEMIEFHRSVMPCEKALRHAIRKIKELDMAMIAPQHGSILNRKREIEFVSDVLESLDGVGIDAIVQD
jgi:flavorubredoxin